AKEAVRLALEGVATGVACEGCPPLRDLLARYEKAGGRFMVCPVCFDAKQLDKGDLVTNAELAGPAQLWEWVGDGGAPSFSYGRPGEARAGCFPLARARTPPAPAGWLPRDGPFPFRPAAPAAAAPPGTVARTSRSSRWMAAEVLAGAA